MAKGERHKEKENKSLKYFEAVDGHSSLPSPFAELQLQNFPETSILSANFFRHYRGKSFDPYTLILGSYR